MGSGLIFGAWQARLDFSGFRLLASTDKADGPLVSILSILAAQDDSQSANDARHTR